MMIFWGSIVANFTEIFENEQMENSETICPDVVDTEA